MTQHRNSLLAVLCVVALFCGIVQAAPCHINDQNECSCVGSNQKPYLTFYQFECACLLPTQLDGIFTRPPPPILDNQKQPTGRYDCSALPKGKTFIDRLGVKFDGPVEIRVPALQTVNRDTARAYATKYTGEHKFKVSTTIYANGYAGQVFMAEWFPPKSLEGKVPKFVGLKVLFDPLKAQAAKLWRNGGENPQAGAKTDHSSSWWQKMKASLTQEMEVAELYAGHLDDSPDAMPHAAKTFGHFIAEVPANLVDVLQADRPNGTEPHAWNSKPDAKDCCTPKSHSLFIVSEWLPFGDLHSDGVASASFTKVSPYERAMRALGALSHLGGWLQYMEQKKLVHRDIKPKNIMWDGYFGARVIDFGEAVSYDERTGYLASSAFQHPFQDKQQALPPEALKEHPNAQRRYAKADLYGVGLVFLQLLVVGDDNPKSKAFLELMSPKKDTVPTEKQLPHVPKGVYMLRGTDLAPRLQGLVNDMLQPKPAQRIKVEHLTESAATVFADMFAVRRGASYTLMHGSLRRPIQGGAHIATQIADHGTIGLVLTDSVNKYLLTNRHVFADIAEVGGRVVQPALDDYSKRLFGDIHFAKTMGLALYYQSALLGGDENVWPSDEEQAELDRIASILNAGPQRFIASFDPKMSSKSLDYAVAKLTRDPDVFIECSVRWNDDTSMPVRGVHPLAGLKQFRAPDVAAFKDLNIVKMGSVTGMRHGAVAATNVMSGNNLCHFVVVGARHSEFQEVQMPVDHADRIVSPTAEEFLDGKSFTRPFTLPLNRFDVATLNGFMDELKKIDKDAAPKEDLVDLAAQLTQRATFASLQGDSGSSYLANLEPKGRAYYALGLHTSGLKVWVVKKSSFDRIWPNKQHVEIDGGVIVPRETSLLRLPTVPPAVVVATIKVQDQPVDVEVFSYHKGACGVSIDAVLGFVNMHTENRPIDVCAIPAGKGKTPVPAAWIDECSLQKTQRLCLRLVAPNTSTKRCVWTESTGTCAETTVHPRFHAPSKPRRANDPMDKLHLGLKSKRR